MFLQAHDTGADLHDDASKLLPLFWIQLMPVLPHLRVQGVRREVLQRCCRLRRHRGREQLKAHRPSSLTPVRRSER